MYEVLFGKPILLARLQILIMEPELDLDIYFEHSFDKKIGAFVLILITSSKNLRFSSKFFVIFVIPALFIKTEI